MINYSEIAKLEKIQESNESIVSKLVNVDDQSVLYTFLWAPVSYSYSGQTQFQSKYALFGTKPHTRFQHAKVGVLTLSNLNILTPCLTHNLLPQINTLDALRYPAPGALAPPKLAWVAGTNTIFPLYLQSFSFEQIDQVNNQPTHIVASLQFIGADRIQFGKPLPASAPTPVPPPAPTPIPTP